MRKVSKKVTVTIQQHPLGIIYRGISEPAGHSCFFGWGISSDADIKMDTALKQCPSEHKHSHIRGRVLVPVQQRLRSHVPQSAATHFAHVGPSLVHLKGEPEVRDLGRDAPLLALTAPQQYVGRLQSRYTKL